MFNYFPPPPENHTLLKKCCTVGQATDGHMTHARCMLDTQGYKHTLRICNIYCFTAAKMVSRKRLNVRLIRAFLITVWPFRNEGSQMRFLASSYFSVCMRVACWIPKATNTHSEYVIFIALPLQKWFREIASMLGLYVRFSLLSGPFATKVRKCAT